MQPPLDQAVLEDIASIGRIAAVPRILETVAHITGLRFTAVARVTESTWTACATYDDLGFGLVAGGQLALESTICNDIRQSLKPVIFETRQPAPAVLAPPHPAHLRVGKLRLGADLPS